MTGIVLELQRDAMDGKVGINELLRKAYLVSRKLDVEDMQCWINSEMHGYHSDGDESPDVPSYRKLMGQLIFSTPHGDIPARGHADLIETFQRVTISHSAAEIDDVVRNWSPKNYRAYPAKASEVIRGFFDTEFEPRLKISRQQFLRIIEAVRANILEWALGLEKNGVVGEGLSFTDREKMAANKISYHTVNNIGTMQNSQLQVHSSGNQSIVSGAPVEKIGELVRAVEQAIDLFELNAEKRAELTAEVETIKLQLGSPKPKSSVLRECLLSTKNILEGAAGNLLASGLASQIPALISFLP